MCKRKVAARKLIPRARGKAPLAMPHHPNTGNTRVQGPVEYLEEAAGMTEELEEVYDVVMMSKGEHALAVPEGAEKRFAMLSAESK